MMIAALLAFLLVQDEPVEAVIRRLDSEQVQDREKAAAELRRRGDAAMDALLKAEKRAVEPAEKARIRRALEDVLGYRPLTLDRVRAVRLTCALPAMKARAAVAELARLSGLPIEVEGPADVDPPLAELDGRDATLESLLDSLAQDAGGFWIVDGRRLLVVLAGKVPIRLFDVRDMVEAITDDELAPLESDESDALGQSTDARYPINYEDLANLIKNEVSPKSWDEAEGRSLQFYSGWLVLRNTPDVLRAAESTLQKYRSRFLSEVRVEIEAYAVKDATKAEELSVDRLREEALEGKTARRVTAFERTARNQRRIALKSITRYLFLTRYDETGSPVTEPFSSGARLNVRASMADDRASVRLEISAAWSRLLSVERKKETAGEIQVPTFSSHTISPTLNAPAGRFVVLGRIGDAKLAEGLPDLVVVGRFTPVERPEERSK